MIYNNEGIVSLNLAELLQIYINDEQIQEVFPFESFRIAMIASGVKVVEE